jgi:hypothetical protein
MSSEASLGSRRRGPTAEITSTVRRLRVGDIPAHRTPPTRPLVDGGGSAQLLVRLTRGQARTLARLLAGRRYQGPVAPRSSLDAHYGDGQQTAPSAQSVRDALPGAGFNPVWKENREVYGAGKERPESLKREHQLESWQMEAGITRNDTEICAGNIWRREPPAGGRCGMPWRGCGRHSTDRLRSCSTIETGPHPQA